MTTYEVGQTAAVQLKVTSDGTTLADLGGGNPTCTVTKPDGTTTSATVTKVATGVYNGTLVTTMAGRHRFTFTGTGTNSGALPWSDVVDVWPADPRLIISLADARAALNLPTGTRVADDELRLYISATTQIIEDIVGPVLTEGSHSWSTSGGDAAILLPERVNAITSVTENGNTLTSTEYVLSAAAGILYRGSTINPMFWAPGVNNVTVTYSVGAQVIPPNIILAAREEVRFLYSIGQQGGRPSLGGQTTDFTFTPSGFAVPNRVAELCAPSSDLQVGWFA